MKFIKNFITAVKDKIIIDNLTFDMFSSSVLLQSSLDLISKNLELSAQALNLSLNELLNIKTNSNLIIGSALQMQCENILDFDIRKISGRLLINRIDKNIIMELLKFYDPLTANMYSSKLKLALKLAEPTAVSIFFNAGMASLHIQFNSRIIDDFRIDKIQISNLKKFLDKK